METVDDVQEVQMPREHGQRKRQMSGTHSRGRVTPGRRTRTMSHARK